MQSHHDIFLTMVFTVTTVLMGHAQPQDQSVSNGGPENPESCSLAMAETSPQEQPGVKKSVPPLYPELAKKAGLEGKVWVKVFIDEQGKVEKALMDSSTNSVFDGAALDAIKQWEFTPAKKDGKPIKCEIVVPFKFKLADSPKYGVREEIKFLQDDVLKLLRGESTETVKTKIGSSAYAIIGKKDEYLPTLFSDKGKRGSLVDGPGVETEYSRLAMNEAGDMAFLVLKTKSAAKHGERFHTVIFVKSGEGAWSIVAWHAGE
jgi:TonB family protein